MNDEELNLISYSLDCVVTDTISIFYTTFRQRFDPY